MERFEQEPKLDQIGELIEELRGKGYKIERVEIGKDEAPDTCDFDKDCFSNAEWIIEGEFCCSQHTEKFLNILKESEDTREQRTIEREERIKERKEDVK